jgi:hypothetical protein
MVSFTESGILSAGSRLIVERRKGEEAQPIEGSSQLSSDQGWCQLGLLWMKGETERSQKGYLRDLRMDVRRDRFMSI